MTAEQLSALVEKTKPSSLTMSLASWRKIKEGSDLQFVPHEEQPGSDLAFDGVPVHLDETAIGIMFG